ncbi:Protein kinase-like domain protein [Metarhizium album ARSEF 1941]|uniref:non-specific serine/threonine protein kinase n=1 Tax=Metarhizium album (strain ARSEF 1941) TaxID=1081103 RepID=A0A0B2WTQ9_METAS|nr:Protein kinase-like domain protein [Metarhizium album ARSEF 1941]KHN96300.1 Protein kinase-like domain protein [Metarhizium album ARSEF 1941]
MARFVTDLLYSLGNCLNCFPGSPTLKINSRSFKILRLLGEVPRPVQDPVMSLDQGGFSYVYLVQDTATHELLALKKIRCPFGAESVQQAMREVDAYRLFAHVPGVISAVDHAVATERGADEATKTVYVLLPYYRRGNLQDMINANLVNGGSFPERHLMTLFLGVCRAVRSMHEYRPPPAERMEMGDEDEGEGDAAAAGRRRRAGSKLGGRSRRSEADDEEDQERPLMGAEDRVSGGGGATRSYAHRDVKPGNIMIDDSGSAPILMDLGSVAASPTPITSQSVALQVQDTAAEHSTMPYRAPELFDVHTGSVVDTKTDIWSLGCTLYACLVGKSPFEMRSDETGGTLSLCVLGGDWRFPDETPAAARRVNTIGQAKARAASASASASASAAGPEPACPGPGPGPGPSISEPVRDIVRRCLRVDPAERPDIGQLIALVERVVESLPDDGAL